MTAQATRQLTMLEMHLITAHPGPGTFRTTRSPGFLLSDTVLVALLLQGPFPGAARSSSPSHHAGSQQGTEHRLLPTWHPHGVLVMGQVLLHTLPTGTCEVQGSATGPRRAATATGTPPQHPGVLGSCPSGAPAPSPGVLVGAKPSNRLPRLPQPSSPNKRPG